MKAVLVIDMPMMCCECKFFRFANNDDWESSETICTINEKHCENGIDYKPRVCPLRPLPEKLKSDSDCDKIDEYFEKKHGFKRHGSIYDIVHTWNACLDEILGETE